MGGNASIVPQSNFDEILKYLESEGRITKTEDGVDVWITEREIADYFGVTRQAVSLHINTFEQDNPEDFKTCCKVSLRRNLPRHFNLNILTYVGYRLQNTAKTIAFRKAVAGLLRQHVATQLQARLNEADSRHANDLAKIGRLQKELYLADTDGSSATRYRAAYDRGQGE